MNFGSTLDTRRSLSKLLTISSLWSQPGATKVLQAKFAVDPIFVSESGSATFPLRFKMRLQSIRTVTTRFGHLESRSHSVFVQLRTLFLLNGHYPEKEKSTLSRPGRSFRSHMDPFPGVRCPATDNHFAELDTDFGPTIPQSRKI